MAVRVCWIVTIPIVFHRVKESSVAAQANLDILDNQKEFVPIAEQCGNPLYALNYDQAEASMLNAASRITQAYKFSMAAVILMCAEVFVPCLFLCL